MPELNIPPSPTRIVERIPLGKVVGYEHPEQPSVLTTAQSGGVFVLASEARTQTENVDFNVNADIYRRRRFLECAHIHTRYKQDSVWVSARPAMGQTYCQKLFIGLLGVTVSAVGWLVSANICLIVRTITSAIKSYNILSTPSKQSFALGICDAHAGSHRSRTPWMLRPDRDLSG